MLKEKRVRDWYGVIYTAAEDAVKELNEVYPLRDVQERMARLLLRQYGYEIAVGPIMSGEDVSRSEAEAAAKSFYSDLMEDALGGISAGAEDEKIALFLFACTQGVEESEVFRSLLRQLLGPECPANAQGMESLSNGLMDLVDDRVCSFGRKREKERAEEFRKANARNEDDPPPWLDEFEYIDWCITHR